MRPGVRNPAARGFGGVSLTRRPLAAKARKDSIQKVKMRFMARGDAVSRQVGTRTASARAGLPPPGHASPEGRGDTNLPAAGRIAITHMHPIPQLCLNPRARGG